MLKMRLQRVGRKNDPSYRLVVTDSRTGPKSGKHVDYLGSYDPKSNRVEIKADRAKDWLSKGVQPSPTVHNILVGQKIIDAKKVNVLPRKSPIVNEEAEKAKAEAAAVVEAKEAEVVEETPAVAPEEAAPAEEAPAPEAEETPVPDEAPAAEEEKAS
ncbi:MAG: 30S ribosomal protein S16 [Candidatus Paceibacterota bacterium]